jgi:galactoside O-acetyltransferase
MKKIIRVFKKIRKLFEDDKKKSLNNILLKNGLVKLGHNSSIDSLDIEIRVLEPDKKNRTFVEIGTDSFLSGKFTFETSEGFIEVGNRTFIGWSSFVCTKKISIGSDVLIAWGCTIMDTDSHSLHWPERSNDVKDHMKSFLEGKPGKYKNWDVVQKKEIVIENKAWIGFNSIILKGVTIGEGAVVGAGSVVTKDVPPFTLVAGNPAKIIRKIE